MEEIYALTHGSAAAFSQIDMLKSNHTACIFAANASYDNALLEALRCLSEKGQAGVYVSATRSFDGATAYLKSNGIDVSKLIIIDAMMIELMFDNDAYEIKKQTLLPQPMEQICSAVVRGTAANRGSFVLFDSVEMYARYEDARSAHIFFSQILNNLRTSKISAVAISTPSTAPVGLEEIYSLFDCKIKIC
ncbi:MAG: hypothetical protein WC408_04365 [Candidatus Micrarchaeia archaeon]|jgi:archaellum biogenesis ATPase FlaH